MHNTVEPLNKGHVGASHFVPRREVALLLELCIVVHCRVSFVESCAEGPFIRSPTSGPAILSFVGRLPSCQNCVLWSIVEYLLYRVVKAELYMSAYHGIFCGLDKRHHSGDADHEGAQ